MKSMILPLVAVTALASFSICAVPRPEPPLQQGPCFPSELINFTFAPSEATGLDENYRSRIVFTPGAAGVRRVVWERSDALSAWQKSEVVHSVSFEITAVAFREGGRVLYVAGIQPRGDCKDVIEKWTFPEVDGSIAMRAGLSPTSSPSIAPVGTPSPPLVLTTTVVGGGYIPPSGRGAQSPSRETIYEGTSLGHIRSMVADPQGRFLLMQAHGDSGIYQVDLLDPNAVPTLVFVATSAETQAARRMMVYDLAAAGGRVFILSAPQGDVMPPDAGYVLIRDANNDGVMDSLESFSATAWASSPFVDRSTWIKPIYANGFQLQY